MELHDAIKSYIPNPLNSPITHPSCDALTSRSELLEWAINNQCTSFELLQEDLKKLTFRDDNGVLRYKQSWLPAPDDNDFAMDDESKKVKYFLQTGCSEVFLTVPSSSYNSTDQSNNSGNVVTVKILSDWKRLWRYLAYDPSDELAEYATLLRSCIAFFMHERSLKIYWALFIYDSSIYLWFSSTVSRPQMLYSFLIFIHRLTCGMFYIAVRRLYTDNHIEEAVQNNLKDARRIRRRGTINLGKMKYKLHWSGALRHYCLAMFGELSSLFCCETTRAEEPASSICNVGRDVASFDQLINIALKFMTQHCEVHVEKVSINRRSYKCWFLCISFFLPLCCFCRVLVNIFSQIALCELISPSDCQNVIIEAVLRFGYLPETILLYLMYGALLVSIIGLTYGTELAYHMVHCWMKRFAALRKVARFQEESDDVDRDNKSAAAEDTMLDSSPSSLSPDGQLRELSKRLRADAAEQYLFVVEFMRQAGAVWAPVIVWMYVYALFLLLGMIYLYLVFINDDVSLSSNVIWTMVTFTGQIIMFAIFPTWSLAHANSLIAPLLELFTMASKEDFDIIGIAAYIDSIPTYDNFQSLPAQSLLLSGGRDLWLDFVHNVPPAWTVHGLWITYSRILGLVTALASAGGTAFIAYQDTAIKGAN